MIRDTLESIGFKVSSDVLPDDHPAFNGTPLLDAASVALRGPIRWRFGDDYEEAIVGSGDHFYEFTTAFQYLQRGEVAVMLVNKQQDKHLGVVVFGGRSLEAVATDLKKLGVTPQ